MKNEKLPETIWTLRNIHTGEFVPAHDCAGDPFLVYRTEADARQGVKAHLDLWDVECVRQRMERDLWKVPITIPERDYLVEEDTDEWTE